MARALRIEYPGAIYLITARGNERRAIFRSEADRRRFVVKLSELVLSTYGLSKTELLKRGNRESKDLWMRLLNRESGLKQREIGTMMGHSDGATVSRRLAYLTSALAADPKVAARYDDLRGILGIIFLSLEDGRWSYAETRRRRGWTGVLLCERQNHPVADPPVVADEMRMELARRYRNRTVLPASNGASRLPKNPVSSQTEKRYKIPTRKMHWTPAPRASDLPVRTRKT